MKTSNSGIIFDIQRCSMYDGPGIRTTVFLKGCPLSCKWCHNPESQSLHPQLAFYSNRCTLCGQCSKLCPDVHKIHNNLHTVNYSSCTSCTKCCTACPSDALKIIGKSITVDEIITIVKKDIIYYKQTSGGVTITGGEPFFQYGFLKEILIAAKAENIHTCVETCGYTSTQFLADSSDYVDLYLFDYKVTSTDLHKKYTGVDNVQIRKNFEFLYSQEKKMILRCPVIPGYNDTIEHFQGIAQMERRFRNLDGIEIMPYHSLGTEKAEAIGKPNEISAPTADESVKADWRKLLISSGCSRAVVETII